ncbi:uncharacterized protein, partial [Linepithema humile]|uniref:uncharacterized protein n=1 Tax=Linepithema humile TaxID=83485 RepID=UPI00351E2FC2
MILARGVPLDLSARSLTHVYNQVRNMSREGDPLEHTSIVRLCIQAKREAITQWKERLTSVHTITGTRVRQAIIPYMKEWYKRRHGSIIFHSTQILTGHGCFQEYLYKIRRTASPGCKHCCDVSDSAQHTLEFCPAWEQDRAELRRVLGRGVGLDIRSVIAEIVDNRTKWKAFNAFCGR